MTGNEDSQDRLDEAGRLAREESSVGDRPGGPTWPSPEMAQAEPAPPPVGMNWGAVAKALGVDLQVLEHDGLIALAGEYFPEAGYALDPVSFVARFVDVGDVALRPCYFLGDLAIRHFHTHLSLDRTAPPAGEPILPSTRCGTIIGLFGDEQMARRAKDKILRGALGSGLEIQNGPLGFELHVRQPESPGGVATTIAAAAGALISIGGRPAVPSEAPLGPVATGAGMVGEQANQRRPGLGTTGQVQAPAADWGGSEPSA